ncbi:hypothetical protein F5146DRAFT_1138027 [Armillaria mellea]|nr:hypothetical protein F5146DRAFT_1138027 [Armillaria mellea]
MIPAPVPVNPYSVYSSAYPAYYPYTAAAAAPQLQPEPSPPSPVPPAVSPAAASEATQRIVSAELKRAGFDAAEPAAVIRLEHEVVAIVEALYHRAHEYANLANRAGAVATDLGARMQRLRARHEGSPCPDSEEKHGPAPHTDTPALALSLPRAPLV